MHWELPWQPAPRMPGALEIADELEAAEVLPTEALEMLDGLLVAERLLELESLVVEMLLVDVSRLEELLLCAAWLLFEELSRWPPEPP